MTRPTMLAADHIRELTQHHTTRGRIDRFVPIPNVLTDHADGTSVPAWTRIRTVHEAQHEPLLQQLLEATTQSSAGGAWGGGTPTSKPAARLDAIAVLQRIERQSRTLLSDLNIPHKAGEAGSLERRLLLISGKVGSTEHDQVKAWWVAARCATGWEQQPYTPDVPCPNVECERWSTLRIRLDDYLASCVECGETWSEANYVQLGDYIRWASEHLRGSKHWLIDEAGYPTECMDAACATERMAMAERKLLRKALPVGAGERISA